MASRPTRALAGHALLGSLSDVGGLRAPLKLVRYLGFLPLDPMVMFVGLHAYTVSGYRVRAPRAASCMHRTSARARAARAPHTHA
jgi:hypothetical protein